jgi:hypothetical protein
MSTPDISFIENVIDALLREQYGKTVGYVLSVYDEGVDILDAPLALITNTSENTDNTDNAAPDLPDLATLTEAIGELAAA